MKRMLGGILVGIVLVIPGARAAGGELPPVGSYGFDSLKPETTRCARLDAAAIARLKDCTYSDRNSFGDSREGYACRVGKRSGFMAYKTKDACRAELELERANGD